MESHPVYTWYEQCITFNSFPEPKYELMYNFFGFVLLYGVPLITILFCYTCILYKIYKTTTVKGNGMYIIQSSYWNTNFFMKRFACIEKAAYIFMHSCKIFLSLSFAYFDVMNNRSVEKVKYEGIRTRKD